jgi:RNA polymerase sigma-70 factor (ECF subfamily)
MKKVRQAGEPGAGPAETLLWEHEALLVERATRGDKKAVAELYGCHVEAVYRYVASRVRDKAVAEDLTAQVFVGMLEGLPTYQPRGKPFLCWLYRIACARTADYWRKVQRRKEVDLDESWVASQDRPEALLEAEADWLTAMDLLAQLSDDQQDVLILRFVGELSLVEVAETLAKSVGATKALQHRALASLSRLLEHQRRSGRHE